MYSGTKKNNMYSFCKKTCIAVTNSRHYIFVQVTLLNKINCLLEEINFLFLRIMLWSKVDPIS
jgi:hypothetical protein